jgi:hypothetical protein
MYLAPVGLGLGEIRGLTFLRRGKERQRGPWPRSNSAGVCTLAKMNRRTLHRSRPLRSPSCVPRPHESRGPLGWYSQSFFAAVPKFPT